MAVYEKSYCTLLRILSSIHTPAAERRIFKSHSAVTVYKRHIGNNVKTQGCRDFRLRYRLGCEGTLSTQTNVIILTAQSSCLFDTSTRVLRPGSLPWTQQFAPLAAMAT